MLVGTQTQSQAPCLPWHIAKCEETRSIFVCVIADAVRGGHGACKLHAATLRARRAAKDLRQTLTDVDAT